MKGDFSRRTFDRRKHYSAVLQEQGRLLTDADFDEEHRILANEIETATLDIVGGCGGPIGAAGFGVTLNAGSVPVLSAGRYYAGGMPVLNERDIAYTRQPDRFPADIGWPPRPGRYVLVLDTWRRLVTALDNPAIREVALGGPTTSSREQTIWQVRHLAVPANWVCSDALPPVPDTTGTMAARAEPEATTTRPCLVPPLAGYTGLENQLYRVEIFASGAALDLAAATLLPVVSIPAGATNEVVVADASTLHPGDIVEVVQTAPANEPLDATFAQVAAADTASGTVALTSRLPDLDAGVTLALRPAAASVVVSRENGSVVTTIERIVGREITVRDLGPDDVLGFAPGQWVELTDDPVELEPRVRQLRQIEAIDLDRRVVILRTAAQPLSGTPDGVQPLLHPKLRRWDAALAVVFLADGTGWIHLENGIEVRFTAGQYRNGDYWQVPARAAIVDAASGNIEWPQRNGAPATLAPAGIDHHLCPLAVIDVTGGPIGPLAVNVVSDCRHLFPPTTELTTLLYVGGDGQEATPGGGASLSLPAPLAVRVVNGSHPVAGAKVEFHVEPGNGIVNNGASPILTSNAEGVVTCPWALDPNTPAQNCDAFLLAPSGARLPHEVVQFHATIDRDTGGGARCCCVSVGREGDFKDIAEAISVLVDRGERDICLCLIAGDHSVGDLVPRPPGREKVDFHLTITGCGRATRVHVEGEVFLDHWASVRFEDFDLLFLPRRSLLLEEVQDVVLAGLHIRGVALDHSLVRIHDAARVQVSSCVIEPGRNIDRQRLVKVFSGTGVLETIWDRADEDRFRQVALSAAGDLVQVSEADRRRLADVIVQQTAALDRDLSPALRARLERLAHVLASSVDAVRLANAIEEVRAQAARELDAVGLEIGASDALQGEIADPAAVTPATVVVEDNEIAGGVSFYGRAGGQPLNVDERERLAGVLKGGNVLGGLAGTVHLRDNRFHRLRLAGAMSQALRDLALGKIDTLPTLFESFLMTTNVVDGDKGELAALHTAFTGNDFTIAALLAPTTQPVVLDLVADTAILTTNHGATVLAAGGGVQPAVIHLTARTSDAVANLELDVQ